MMQKPQAHAMTASDVRDAHARHKALSGNLRLLRPGPTPPSLNAANNFNAPTPFKLKMDGTADRLSGAFDIIVHHPPGQTIDAAIIADREAQQNVGRSCRIRSI